MGGRRALDAGVNDRKACCMYDQTTPELAIDPEAPMARAIHPLGQPRAAIQQVAPRPVWANAVSAPSSRSGALPAR